MLHGIRCRITFAILGLSLLVAGVASAATVNGVVDLTDTPGVGDSGVQVALTVFDTQEYNSTVIPAMGHWGLILMGLLLVGIAWLLIRRRSLGGLGTGIGILLMILAVVPNVVGTARSGDPFTVVTSGAGGTYSFTGVAVGQWGVSAFKDGYMLSSSSLPSGLVPVALNIASAGETATINLNMTPDTGCPVAKGVGDPEPVPMHYWASIKASPEWNQLSEVGKAGTQVLEGSATLVRAIGTDISSVIVPMSAPSIASNESRNFISHFDASGVHLGSYVIDIASPVGHFDEDMAAVPALVRLSSPSGVLISEARFSKGRLISQVEGPGLPRTAGCIGVAVCLATRWATMPRWMQWVCRSACVTCFTAPQPLSCTACVGCMVSYVSSCWCMFRPCPPLITE